ncbi:eukaryotic translation initiation factor 2B subunit 2 [Sistotremastrum niveocremeum HHB9708]|uniref:Translation initiation factor eIF2B subunit beta n=1 Tax=Sistotremastrum niveocremeum HHB9708 TaxID=1314777 RepID=A0A164P4L9_9AGAM|nr:eukaryotic translation initiation factor 2B subunit 2 [Sistotremastrum niveocremeum HHB9708]
MDSQVDNLIWKLRRRQIVGSRLTAIETLLVLRQYITKAKFTTIDQLIQKIKGIGARLVAAQPTEPVVGNIVRKVLHHIREEYKTAANKPGSSIQSSAFSLRNFVVSGQPRHQATLQKTEARDHLLRSRSDWHHDNHAESLKPVIMEAIQDIFDELETVYESVSKSAKDHIHSDEIILTIGKSRTVESFLKAAAHTRKFTVIVAETAPSYGGKSTAKALASAGISTFLVPDSSIYALMSRVNKVILGAHAVLAQGGIFAVSGSLMVATAARAHSTPVVVCTGQFKLTPLWNLNNEYGSADIENPDAVLGFDEGSLVDKVDVVNPYYDYVKPELIDVLITNDGDHPPSSVYRLIKEAYDDADHEL